MKKVYIVFIAVLSMSILLFGCSSKEKATEKDKEEGLNLGLDQVEKVKDFSLSQAQKIEVLSADHSELVLKVIDKKQDISTFVATLKVNKWGIANIPKDAIKENIYKMYQNETTKLEDAADKKRKELKQVATLTTYKGTPYVNVKVKNLSLDLKVPRDVSKYLSSQSN
ncbi:hypothetical protein SFC65_24395 [Priestia filamentosa]|uniref:hypothetical protein n=1 Tax=Priestia filamentosa TaxID=1402861 RepID=UPI0039823F86